MHAFIRGHVHPCSWPFRLEAMPGQRNFCAPRTTYLDMKPIKVALALVGARRPGEATTEEGTEARAPNCGKPWEHPGSTERCCVASCGVHSCVRVVIRARVCGGSFSGRACCRGWRAGGDTADAPWVPHLSRPLQQRARRRVAHRVHLDGGTITRTKVSEGVTPPRRWAKWRAWGA